MNREPKNLHMPATMPTDEGDVPVFVEFWVMDGGECCQLQIRKRGNPQRLWANLSVEQAKMLAKRLKAAAKIQGRLGD